MVLNFHASNFRVWHMGGDDALFHAEMSDADHQLLFSFPKQPLENLRQMEFIRFGGRHLATDGVALGTLFHGKLELLFNQDGQKSIGLRGIAVTLPDSYLEIANFRYWMESLFLDHKRMAIW